MEICERNLIIHFNKNWYLPSLTDARTYPHPFRDDDQVDDDRVAEECHESNQTVADGDENDHVEGDLQCKGMLSHTGKNFRCF